MTIQGCYKYSHAQAAFATSRQSRDPHSFKSTQVITRCVIFKRDDKCLAHLDALLLIIHHNLDRVNKMHSLEKRVGNDGQKIALTGLVHSKHFEETAFATPLNHACLFCRDSVAWSRALSRTVVAQVRMINRSSSEALE